MSRQLRYVHLTIPQPCTESWDAMTPVQGGKFCATCQQTVTDFSMMTDAQVLAFVQQYGLGCGSFRADQLERELIAPLAPRNTYWKSLGIAALSLFGAVNVFGQEGKKDRIEQGQTAPSEQGSVDQLFTIKGKITTWEGSVAVGAIVELFLEGIKRAGTITDKSGQYALSVPYRDEKARYIIHITFDGSDRTITDIPSTLGVLQLPVKMTIITGNSIHRTVGYVKPIITQVGGGPKTLTRKEIEEVPSIPLSPIPKKKTFLRRLLFWEK